jgi:hypothetical protein
MLGQTNNNTGHVDQSLEFYKNLKQKIMLALSVDFYHLLKFFLQVIQGRCQ